MKQNISISLTHHEEISLEVDVEIQKNWVFK